MLLRCLLALLLSRGRVGVVPGIPERVVECLSLGIEYLAECLGDLLLADARLSLEPRLRSPRARVAAAVTDSTFDPSCSMYSMSMSAAACA